MSVAHLQKWDVTAIEIALDLKTQRVSDFSRLVFSGPAEPRICLVASFVLTPQLKRIVAAVDRAMPARLPSGLRIAPATTRSAPSAAAAVSLQPMLALLRLQSRLVRAIEPGLANDVISLRMRHEMDEATTRFVADFISCKTLPSFEPACTVAEFDAIDLTAIGITLYQLGRAGTPQSILAHWPYPQNARSLPLRDTP
ncbi:MAG: hypothetical protein WCC84_13465 [Candidatus Cybelea sp.]